MTRNLILTLFVFLTMTFNQLNGQISLARTDGESKINIKHAYILSDDNDELAVKTSIALFAGDIEMVSSIKPKIESSLIKANTVIIAGTIQKNKWIQNLSKTSKIKTDSLQGQWERYGIFLVNNPFPGIKQALVIAGSDRRAVSYGLFSISEIIGVSPWYWWADVPVKKHDNIFLQIKNFISPPPSVKYRGLFINDEDWGLLPWAKHTFDPELKDIGPKTYAKVFELLLRLKANYLCPAMHEASGAFNKYPQNKLVADSFGIVMGSVHPEPLLFNNASEWDKKTMGEWNYMTNKENILKVLNKRVQENSPYENVYTLALRGLHDRAMEGNYPMKEKVNLVGKALKDQRDILKKHINKPLNQIPQAFTPYKEVLDIYLNGLDLPDDVTIVWPDDNYGYIKQLSNEDERKRSGGSGVYYHASYLGSPHDYLWLSSTPPNLMYEEMSKAYKTGADRLWLLNAGDIKSCEAPVTQFLNMAYQIQDFNFENTPDFQAKWLSNIYGNQYYPALKDITNTYDRLAFARKPEFMGWGYEWNSNKYPKERPTDTEFSFEHYGEAETRINDYLRIENMAEKIWKELPVSVKPSFFQLVYYPVKSAGLMNRMWLTAQKQRQFVYEKRASANDLKKQVDILYDSLYIVAHMYNGLLDGKWNKIVSLRQGVTASYFEKPKLDSISVPQSGTLTIKTGSFPQQNLLPTFNSFSPDNHSFDLYNTGTKPISWNAECSAPWILISKNKGILQKDERVYVGIDWKKLSGDEHVQGFIRVSAGNQSQTLYVSAFNPSLQPDHIKGFFLEKNGVVSIPAADFQRKVENNDIKMAIINQLGYEGNSVMLGDPVAPVQNAKRSDAPNLQYDFFTFNRGMVDVYTYVLPTFPLSSNRDFGFHESANSQTKYGVSIDGGAIAFPSSSAPEYSQKWSESVVRNAAINKSTLYIDKPGKHTLKIICSDPGIVIQKIVIDFGGLKRSYLGPPPTKVN